jgi:hypothetical protein
MLKYNDIPELFITKITIATVMRGYKKLQASIQKGK